MKKIGIDIRCLAKNRKSGVEEYVVNLLHEIFSLDKKNEYRLFFNSYTESQFDFGQFEKYPNVSLCRFRIPNKILNFLFWYLGWPHIDKMLGGVDVVFMPNIAFGGVSRKTKLILTVHDLSFERHPETFSWKRRFWHSFVSPKKLCQKAEKIIAVSNSTKNDLVGLYGINAKKIVVLQNAVSEKYHPISRNDYKMISVKEKYKLPYKFILFLGVIEPRKNIEGLIRAYNAFRENCDSAVCQFKLVIAGECGWGSEKIFKEISRSSFKEDIIFLGRVDEDDKPMLYSLASVFVYPSFFEGFGFPPLEAIRCGTPVITSNNSSIPEIYNDGITMIDPDRPEEIQAAMRNILLEKNIENKTSLIHQNDFSWQDNARKFASEINFILE